MVTSISSTTESQLIEQTGRMYTLEKLNEAKKNFNIPGMFLSRPLQFPVSSDNKKRKIYIPGQIAAMLNAFGRAKADKKYNLLKNSDWKRKLKHIEKDIDTIRVEIEAFDWTTKPIKDKWDVQKGEYLRTKRA